MENDESDSSPESNRLFWRLFGLSAFCLFFFIVTFFMAAAWIMPCSMFIGKWLPVLGAIFALGAIKCDKNVSCAPIALAGALFLIHAFLTLLLFANIFCARF